MNNNYKAKTKMWTVFWKKFYKKIHNQTNWNYIQAYLLKPI